MITDRRIVPLVDEGLGNSSYLVDLGDGRALAVDPSRDVRASRKAAASAGLRIAYVAETHLHADFVSGACELLQLGAEVIAGRDGDRDFPHRGVVDGDEVELGGLLLRAVATPGHTPEHTAFLLVDGEDPLAVFTGGSLLVGSAARTDLVSPDRTEELARAQHRSLRRLLELPDHVTVLPTHGAGSLCAAPPGSARTTTIGEQRRENALLADAGEDAFVRRLLHQLGSFPAYFGRLGEVNRRGPRLIGTTPRLPPLDPATVQALQQDDAVVIDVRPVEAFAVGHLPGSVSIPLRDVFATWLGWLVDPPRPLVFVRDPADEVGDLVWQCLKVGFDDLRGELTGGVRAWAAAGCALDTTLVLEPADLTGRQILDVRQAAEYAAGHVPGAINVELGSVLAEVASLPDEPLTVMCGHGERAMSAASLLQRAGRRDIAVLMGGPGDWARATGVPMVVGA